MSEMFLPVENTGDVFVDEVLVVVHKLLGLREVVRLGVKVKFTAGKEKQQKMMVSGRES